MNLSGEGALSREDVAVITAGNVVLLPYDKKGRTVICYDLSRLTDRSRGVRMRMTFYHWAIVAENEMSQDEGCSVLVIARTVTRDPVVADCVKMVMESMAIKVR